VAGCYKWGIGDPDKSLIDEKLAGVWVIGKNSNTTGFHFRPFGRRTYVLDDLVLNGTLEQAQISSRVLVTGWHVQADNVLFLVTAMARAVSG